MTTGVVACSAWLTAGQVVPASVGDWDGNVVGTVHPSAILRLQDPDEREDAYAGFAADLRSAAAWSGR